MERILIIGLGGIGGALAEPLARFLNYSDRKPEIIMIDGDRCESGNLSRQRFDVSQLRMNKAEAWMRRLNREFTALDFSAVPHYVTPGNIRTLIYPGDTVMLCVDNHATRKLVQEHCLRLKTVTLISGGNDYTDGNVQVFRKKNGRMLSPPITAHHPEIAEPADRRPDEIGCDEEVESAPQLLFSNLMAASLMLNAWYSVTDDRLEWSEAYFDLVSNRVRPLARAA